MNPESRRLKRVSAGPTGVDRAALDVALAPGLPVGGCIPNADRPRMG